MSDELKLYIDFRHEKLATVLAMRAGLSVDVSGDNAKQHRQTIGTTAEALDLGDVAAGGYWMITNRDTTNYVQLRAKAGETPFMRLKAGEAAVFRLDNSAVPTAQADTAACDVEFIALDA